MKITANKKITIGEWEKGVREGFLAGINFVYDVYPFLTEVVDERIRNNDYSGFSQVVSEEDGWDEEKWDKEVEIEIEEIIKSRK